jgi:23S rRNA (cytidine1920-2'-O)/16S rRNA (cytidine1409-2'-O)-methyltransferase
MSSPPTKRLDIVLLEKRLVSSRHRAKGLIMAGKILVNDELIDKPGRQIPEDAVVTVKEDLPFVSRGGLKLQAAIETWHIDANDAICMDVGASTGGFTDCLLMNGARKVYAVDVGYGQLAWKLRQDDRVVTIERTNIRHLPTDIIPDPIDIATIDVSFISLKKVVPRVLAFMRSAGVILALIKPQFEVGKGQVGKGGVVRDPEQHDAVVRDLTTYFGHQDLSPGPVIPSPILGPKGNREFIIHLQVPAT